MLSSEERKIIASEMFDLMDKHFVQLQTIANDHCDEIKDIWPLIRFIIDRMEAVSNLNALGAIWDAEIIFRTCLESLFKLLYMCTGDKKSQENKIKEYWCILSEINSLKTSNKVKDYNKQFSQITKTNFLFAPLVLSNNRLSEIQEKMSRSERLSIERRWSFNEIIKYLIAFYNKNNHVDSSSLELLSYRYKLSSHLVHGDEVGVGIIRERNSRNQVDKDAAYDVHFLTLFSDLFSVGVFLFEQIKIFINLPNETCCIANELPHWFNETYEKCQKVVFSDDAYNEYRT